MADTHVVSALKEKRARLAGELAACKLRAIALQCELGSVDNCLRIFRSDVAPATILPRVTNGKSPTTGLPKGAGTRTALDILRETGEPRSTPELAACILERFGKPMTANALEILVKSIQGDFSRRTGGQLVDKLAEIGIEETDVNVRNKIARGVFTATFFIQCLVAIGCTVLHLHEG